MYVFNVMLFFPYKPSQTFFHSFDLFSSFVNTTVYCKFISSMLCVSVSADGRGRVRSFTIQSTIERCSVQHLNWSPSPPPPTSQCGSPHRTQVGGNHSCLRGRGGGPNSDDQTGTLVLYSNPFTVCNFGLQGVESDTAVSTPVLQYCEFKYLNNQWPCIQSLKGSRQPESRGVRNVSIFPILSRTAAIDVLFSINFAVVFDFMYFRFRPVKQNEQAMS